MGPTNDPPLIAVLGVTGGGKTTFISKATGDTRLVIGHGVESCTQDIQLATTKVDGIDVMLIDTPGFDDTHKPDTEILELIAKHLSATYYAGKLLNGLIIVQPVTANRFQGNERRQTRLLEKIVGPDNYGNIILATTMWDCLRDQTQAQDRVDQRTENKDFWGSMVSKGARVVRHENTRDSAINIIRMVYSKPKVELLLQSELKANDGQLSRTSAGLEMNKELNEKCASLVAELAQVRKEHITATQGMKEEIAELQAKLARIEEEKEFLDESRITRSERNVQRIRGAFEDFGDWCEEGLDAHGSKVGAVALAGLALACIVM